jgi:hypothetical protein
MSSFWVYSNPRRGRLLIHRNSCPACEGDKPFVLQAAAGQRARGAWEAADSYDDALQIAAAFSAGSAALTVTPCAICEPGPEPSQRSRSGLGHVGPPASM